MVIGLLAACALLGFSAAYAIAAAAGPEGATAQPTTEPPPPTEPPPTEPPPTVPPREPSIPIGVTVGHVDVGGLLPYEAAAEIRESFARPLVLLASPRRFTVTADDFGARANIRKAVSRARFSRPGTSVPLHVWVSRDRIDRKSVV